MDGNRRIADAQGVNVGLPAHSRRGAEGCRRSQFDPKLPFGAGFKRGSPSPAMPIRIAGAGAASAGNYAGSRCRGFVAPDFLTS